MSDETQETIYKYKIILIKHDNVVAADIYNKIKYIIHKRNKIICSN